MVRRCILQLRYSEKVPWEKEFRFKGPVPTSPEEAGESEEKELKEIKDLAESNGNDPSSWDNPEESTDKELKPNNLTSFQKKEEETAESKTEDVAKAIEDAEADMQERSIGRKGKTHERLSILKIITYSISIISDIAGIIINSGSNYWWYFLGRNFTGLVTKSFILVDYILASNLIIPTEPWIRYRYGPYFRPEDVDCGVCDKAKLEAAGESYEECEKQRLYCDAHIDRDFHVKDHNHDHAK